MSVTVKILDPGMSGTCFVIRESFLIPEDEAPDIIDVPLTYNEEGPLKRYKFRFRTEEFFYYTPKEGTPLTAGNA